MLKAVAQMRSLRTKSQQLLCMHDKVLVVAYSMSGAEASIDAVVTS